MAEVGMTIGVRIRDMDRTRLFVHEVEVLAGEMRVMASPHAERLTRALDRYTGGGDDEGDGQFADSYDTEIVTETVEPCPRCGYTEAV